VQTRLPFLASRVHNQHVRRRRHVRTLFAFGLLPFAFHSCGQPNPNRVNERLPPARPRTIYHIGMQTKDIVLTDTAGTTFSIESFQGRLVVGEFWSTRCPYVARSENARQQLAKKYGARSVVYLAIDSNLDEPPDEMKQYLLDKGSTYAVIVDYGAQLAKQFNATRTPEAFILDRDGVVRFIGGPFSPQQWAKGLPDCADWLEDALDTALEGRSPDPATRPLVGSKIRRLALPPEPWL